jgi:hypothetical protein
VRVAIIGVVGLIAFVGIFGALQNLPSEDRWPEFLLPAATADTLELRASEREGTRISYAAYLKDHSAFGDYLNMGTGTCVPGARTAYDDHGILQAEYRGEFNYHPVLSAQCGLKAFGRYLRGTEADLSEAITYADHLLDLQGDSGGFEYPFAWRYYLTGEDLPAGWTSGMAQGQAMSLLARALMATGDTRYLEGGRMALQHLTTPTEDDGVMTTLADLHPSLSDFIFFEEYVSDPPNYTLNGYMFALLGLYDWSQLPSAYSADQESASVYFEQGIRTLVRLLPYYDLGSWSAYDLGYITFKAEAPNVSNSYHGVHLYLLRALYSVTGEPLLLEYFRKWERYALPDD